MNKVKTMLKQNLTIKDFHIHQYVTDEEMREVLGKRRYKVFISFMGGQTCPMIGNEMAYYPWDVENFLRKPADRFFD